MTSDAVIVEGYELDYLAGTGGMGSVYRGRDQAGDAVAIKVLKPEMAHLSSHFMREAELLRTLEHSAIVQYRDSGTTEDGQPFLIMEWLDGQDLRARLSLERLRLVDSLRATARIAEALEFAHKHGVIHRDIKPSNVFLPHGQVEQAKLLDFGIARWGRPQPTVGTQESRAGTPAYMAPEQVRGRREITSAVDVFSLGCVLFECLTGEHAFVAHHHMAALCKVLMDDPPRASDVVLGIPEPVEELLGRMLAAKPADRPSSGEVARSLDRLSGSLQSLLLENRPPALEARRAITKAEQRIVHVVMAVVGARPFDPVDEPTVWAGDAGPASRAVTHPTGAPGGKAVDGGSLIGLTAELSAFHHLDPSVIVQVEALAAQIHSVGARFSVLGDGSLIAVMDSRRRQAAGYQTAVDHAVNAARCALRLYQVFPHAAVAISSGRAVMKGQRLVGAVIDSAVALLSGTDDSDIHSSASPGVIRLDSLTAALIGSRFEIADDADSLMLQSERRALASQTLLGKQTPFVGRNAELDQLVGVLDECVRESRARAVLVTGDAGLGKSRLCEEFLLRVEQRDEELEVWLARGDPMRGDTSLHLLADALRNVAGIAESEPNRLRWRKLRARVARSVAAEQRERITAFIGELLKLTPLGEDDVQMQAARRDPVRMGDQMQRACGDLLDAETRDHPVLFVVEDLHWGDRATVDLLDQLLQNLGRRPFMVVTLGRPGVQERFADLWQRHQVDEIHLSRLTDAAAQELVHAVVGAAADADKVARLIERSQGNTFYLEELVRSAASGNWELPETVKAMVQARLAVLSPATRQVLRAASVFGKRFWRSGIATLVEEGVPVAESLLQLVGNELISLSPTSEFPRDAEYQFHHDTIRDVAYSMLTDADRALGHRLAAEWLENAGASDPRAIAQHYQRGEEASKAAPFYTQAASDALDRSDFDAAMALARSGMACGASDALLGQLKRVQAIEQVWRGDPGQVATLGAEAMTLLPAGGRIWYEMAAETGIARGKLGQGEETVRIAHELRDRSEDREAISRRVALARLTQQLFVSANAGPASALVEQILAECEGQPDLIIAADLHLARALSAAVAAESDPAAVLVELQKCAECFEAIGDLRQACLHRMNVGYAKLEMGLYEQAELQLRAARVVADRMGLPAVAQGARRNLALVLGQLGRCEEGRELGRQAVDWFAAQGDARMTALTRLYLADVLRVGADLEAADEQVDLAIEALDASYPTYAFAQAARARIALARGQRERALEAAQQAYELLESDIGVDEGASMVRLVHAEALHASGASEAAREAILRAREVLHARAAKIGRTDWRHSFLEKVEVHKRTLALADSWAL